jgi:general secretion pathway protein K
MIIRASADPRPPRGERGFALLLVIWVVALLAVLAAGIAADSSSDAVIARNRMDAAQAEALADAGIALGIRCAIDPNPATRWPADGRVGQVRFAGGTIAIALQDEGGKIDVNAAPLDLIAGLADEFGVSSEGRAALLSGISARRASAQSAAPPPAARFYAAVDIYTADIATLPFADLSELRLLPGVPRAVYERMVPYLTVFSESATLNPLTASRVALLAVPGISPQQVAFYLETREQSAGSIEKPALSGADRYVQLGALHAVTITAQAKAASGAVFSRQAVILLSPNLPQRPYRILSWRRPRSAPAPTVAAAH